MKRAGTLVTLLLTAGQLLGQDGESTLGSVAPDVPEPGSVEAIREHTTAPEYLPSTVAYVPDSPDVPSPAEVLGRLVGTPNELSRVDEIHGYMRRLDEASDRVAVRTLGTSEEGREILLVLVSDAANLAELERLRETTGRLADPRATPRAEMEVLAEQGKLFYYLIGGLHSTETGSPEMLMELAYRLAVSERPEIRAVRDNLVVMITPVVEVDGRDRQVEWFYRHLRGRDLSWEELREFSSPPYWGRYVFHDNNRDGMQLTQALTRAVAGAYFDFHPQVMHDLHESVPLLYISTGHGPYSRAIDPVTVNEWSQFAHHEAGALQALGLPGVWTWGFWDGWWPGYLNSLANNHHSVGRFYETFGNSLAGTFERTLKESKFLGKPVTEVQWYRPWPPGKKLRWSLRDNTNYMQAGVLEGLAFAAAHRAELLRSFWVKAERTVRRGASEAPYAWLFPPRQDDPRRLAHLVAQLLAQRIEVHRLTADLTLGPQDYPAGTYVVRLDQPYGNAARTFLEAQKFPAEEPNPPYDDVAWTWPLLFGVDGASTDRREVLAAAMEAIVEPPAPAGAVEGMGEDLFLLADRGQTSLLAARVRLAAHEVEAAEAEFEAGGVRYPTGSWIVRAPRAAVEEVALALGLSFAATDQLPAVARHALDLPRLAVLHTWTSTQDCGWVRYTLDREGTPYTLIHDDDLERGDLAGRFDVILFPNTGGDLAQIVHGIDPRHGPLPYTATAEFPSHGQPDASPDITGGMGFAGAANLQRFVEGGGLLVTLGNAGTLAVEGGLVRGARRVAAASFNTPGSELRARVLRRDHPVVYGYPETTSVFRGNGPLWDVPERLRRAVVVQFGTKPRDDESEAASQAIEEEELPEAEGPGAASAELPAETVPAPAPAPAPPDKVEPQELVLSGFVKGKEEVDGKPAILDLPAGDGRVLVFAFNPLHRYLNLSDFRLIYNVLLNWNDLPRP
jgi:hypothetical protein